jgi:folate-binding protein YgfZ
MTAATPTDVEAQVRALREGCGLLDRASVGVLDLTGADRQRFLHGLVTCEVKGLAPGAGAYGFFTSVKGRVLADVVVLALADRLRLELPPGGEDEIAAHLGKYRIADRVEWAAPAAVPLTLAGPRAAEALAAAGAPEPPAEPWGSVGATVAGAAVVLVRQGQLGVDAVTLWVGAAEAAALSAALLAAGEPYGLAPVGVEAAEVVRVEAGVPRFGRDYGPDHFPQETGVEGAVSYTKGCYLGQEVVARIHYRGGVHRALRGLALADLPGGGPPPTGAPLLHEGRPAGAVGSAVRSPAHGPIGLAILHLRAAAPGTALEIEGGGRAEVRELPFKTT